MVYREGKSRTVMNSHLSNGLKNNENPPYKKEDKEYKNNEKFVNAGVTGRPL